MTIAPIHPLVALNEYSEEVRAGYGSAAVTVRTLDRVSLAIHANELLIVQGGVASGAASLIAAIVGRRDGAAVIRRGVRHIDATLQIRRALIDRVAMQALVRAWIDHTQDAPYQTTRSLRLTEHERRVLYVFRVREPVLTPIPARTPRRASVWTSWVDAVRQRGGSVLVHTTTAFESVLSVHAAPTLVREAMSAPASLRWLRCEAGRVLNVADRKSADASLSACDPYPTRSPAP